MSSIHSMYVINVCLVYQNTHTIIYTSIHSMCIDTCTYMYNIGILVLSLCSLGRSLVE